MMSVPPYPETDYVPEHHLVGARTIADLFGIVDPDTFDAKIRKAGRNGRRPPQGQILTGGTPSVASPNEDSHSVAGTPGTYFFSHFGGTGTLSLNSASTIIAVP
jgi:hypothetical protein